MVVKGISWVGVQTGRFSELQAFALDVLGLKVVSAGPGCRVYELTHDPEAS